MHTYYAAFIPDQGNIISVLFPDVPGCQTWGKSMPEAFVRAIDALEGHLEALAEDNEPVPAPSDRKLAQQKVLQYAKELEIVLPPEIELQLVPVQEREKTVKATLSFKESTLEMIDRKATALDMTRSAFVAAAARAYEVPRD